MVTSHPPKPTPRLSQQSTRVVLICSLDEPKHREPCRVCRVLWSSSGQGHVGEVVESLKNEGPLETNDTLIYSYMDPYVCWELEPYRFYLAIHVNGKRRYHFFVANNFQCEDEDACVWQRRLGGERTELSAVGVTAEVRFSWAAWDKAGFVSMV